MVSKLNNPLLIVGLKFSSASFAHTPSSLQFPRRPLASAIGQVDSRCSLAEDDLTFGTSSTTPLFLSLYGGYTHDILEITLAQRESYSGIPMPRILLFQKLRLQTDYVEGASNDATVCFAISPFRQRHQQARKTCQSPIPKLTCGVVMGIVAPAGIISERNDSRLGFATHPWSDNPYR